MKLSVIWIATLLLLGARCENTPTRPKPVDAGTPADCDAACAHMAELGCEEAKPTPKGTTCEQVCKDIEGSGTVTLNPACVVGISRCDQVESCAY